VGGQHGGQQCERVRRIERSLARTVSLAADDLDSPIALGVNRSNLWIANKSGNSLTELNATSGSLERVVEGSTYGFSDPIGLAFSGPYLWVVSQGNALTEISAINGALIRVVKAKVDHFDNP